MPLLDRVTTLIKANLNDLIDKAEDPEKLLKQLLLDMQNQYVQVKTQVAMSLANQHLLERRCQENTEQQRAWYTKAELALQKSEEGMARAALEKSLTFDTAAKNFAEQLSDQRVQVQQLKDALHRLEQKMLETRSQADLLVAQHRRARVAAQIGNPANGSDAEVLDRMRWKIVETEAAGQGSLVLGEPRLEQRFAELERTDKVDRLLADLKARNADA